MVEPDRDQSGDFGRLGPFAGGAEAVYEFGYPEFQGIFADLQ
jgi:hypothetical protein